MQAEDQNQEWAKTAQPFEMQNTSNTSFQTSPQTATNVNQAQQQNPYAQQYSAQQGPPQQQQGQPQYQNQPYQQPQQQYQQYPQQAQGGQPVQFMAPPNQFQQPVVVGMPLNAMMGRNQNLGLPYSSNGAPFPIEIICPVCRAQGITMVSNEIGSGTYTVSYILFLCTGILCCWVPCVMPDCQDKVHRCSSCQAEVGIKQYQMC